MLLAVAVAGALGAAARFTVDHLITGRRPGSYPWGTATVNVTGSFGAGLIVGLITSLALAEAVRVVVVAGFFGSYTTFSTWMVETVRVFESGPAGRMPALVNTLGALLAGLVAAGVGLWLGGVAG
jgi:fluoride exporter